MTNGTTPAIGMSVGATTLAAVTADRALIRRPILTLYQNRPPRLGTPAEITTGDEAGEAGAVFADFVDRVGDPEPIPADDGSAHPGGELLADALHTLAYLATDGHSLPATAGVAYPAHWSAADVAVLRTALADVADFAHHQVSLVSDAEAALTALRSSPGLPTAGIILLCDFGGSGSSITLADAGRGCQLIGETVRHTPFSGEAIDQALLNHVVDDLTSSGSLSDALAIGSLNQLRGQCREAKEQLSTTTVTELDVDLPGYHGPVWLTRAEVDGVISEPLDGFIAAAEQTMRHNQVQLSDLSAVVTVGGGAAIPAITTALGEHFGATVVSAPRPQLTAAIGAALRAAHHPGATPESGVAAEYPLSTPPTVIAGAEPGRPEPAAFRPAPPGWAPEPGGPPPGRRNGPVSATLATPRTARPLTEYEPFPEHSDTARVVVHRRSLAVILAAAVAVLLAGAIAVVLLRHAASNEPEPSTVTTEPTGPQTAPLPLPPLSQHPMFPEIPTMVPTPLPVPPPNPLEPLAP